MLAGLRAAVADPVLLTQYAVGALAMGAFVALYNVIGFRLTSPPLSLPASLASLVVLAYTVGGVCSAYAGRLAGRVGRVRVLLAGLGVAVLGVLITLPDLLPTVVLGVVLCTGGFFAAHAVASGWVGARAPAHAKGQASGLYMCLYYVGSSIGGTAGSAAYGHWAWPGLVVASGSWLLLAAVSVLLARVFAARTGTGSAMPPVSAAS